MGYIALAGVIALILGLIALGLDVLYDVKERGSVQLGDFKARGPVWFLLIALGLVLLAANYIGINF
jgi:hypothetical protein